MSVLKSARGRGIGSKLFERAAVCSHNTQVTELYMHCLSRTKTMMYIARKSGMKIEMRTAKRMRICRLRRQIKRASWQKCCRNKPPCSITQSSARRIARRKCSRRSCLRPMRPEIEKRAAPAALFVSGQRQRRRLLDALQREA